VVAFHLDACLLDNMERRWATEAQRLPLRLHGQISATTRGDRDAEHSLPALRHACAGAERRSAVAVRPATGGSNSAFGVDVAIRLISRRSTLPEDIIHFRLLFYLVLLHCCSARALSLRRAKLVRI
jgi:hypothetical protein